MDKKTMLFVLFPLITSQQVSFILLLNKLRPLMEIETILFQCTKTKAMNHEKIIDLNEKNNRSPYAIDL